MKFPIFAFCDGDLFVFSSKDFAESYIEPVDVENSEWILFDATGTKLSPRIVIHHSRLPFCSSEAVEILEPSIPNPESRDELRQMLITSIEELSNEKRIELGFADSDDLLRRMAFEQLLMQAQKVFFKY